MPPLRTSNFRKALEGNPGKRDLTPGLKDTPGAPEMPGGLTQSAADEWRRVCALLHAEARLSQNDYGLLVRHCKTLSYLEECEDDLDERGLLVESRDRGKIKNPSVQLHRTYLSLYHKSCELLGVDPRRRDSSPALEDEDPDGYLD